MIMLMLMISRSVTVLSLFVDGDKNGDADNSDNGDEDADAVEVCDRLFFFVDLLGYFFFAYVVTVLTVIQVQSCIAVFVFTANTVGFFTDLVDHREKS